MLFRNIQMNYFQAQFNLWKKDNCKISFTYSFQFNNIIIYIINNNIIKKVKYKFHQLNFEKYTFIFFLYQHDFYLFSEIKSHLKSRTMGNVQLSDQLKAISVRSILALSLETISPLMYSFSKDFKEVLYI